MPLLLWELGRANRPTAGQRGRLAVPISLSYSIPDNNNIQNENARWHTKKQGKYSPGQKRRRVEARVCM